MYVLPGNTNLPCGMESCYGIVSLCRAMAALEQTMKLLDTKRVTSILRNVLQSSDLMFSNMCVVHEWYSTPVFSPPGIRNDQELSLAFASPSDSEQVSKCNYMH